MECHEASKYKSSSSSLFVAHTWVVPQGILFLTTIDPQQLLGINIFTYILAAAIAFFLSMNAIFGEGWLGSTIGLQGTGTFTERSEKLPNVVDLSEDRFQI